MTSDHETQQTRDFVRTISLGLAAAGIATIIQLATLPTIDRPLTVTVCALALSVPALVTTGLSNHSAIGINMKSSKTRFLAFGLNMIGVLASVVAVGGLFFHFGKRFGLIYSVVAAICLLSARNMEISSKN